MKKKLAVDDISVTNNTVKLFYRNQMSNKYKQEEICLKKMIGDCVHPTDPQSRLSLHIYYKNRKLSQLFIKNNQHEKEIFNVVYQYTCNNDRCQPSQSYIGYTTSTLRQRMTFHAQNCSIKLHNNTVHDFKATTKQLLESTIVLTKCSSKQDLKIAEALHIKQARPTINEQQEFSCATLQIF